MTDEPKDRDKDYIREFVEGCQGTFALFYVGTPEQAEIERGLKDKNFNAVFVHGAIESWKRMAANPKHGTYCISCDEGFNDKCKQVGYVVASGDMGDHLGVMVSGVCSACDAKVYYQTILDKALMNMQSKAAGMILKPRDGSSNSRTRH